MDSSNLQAIILGILQGLTEFLPISSSGHLLIIPWILGWESFGLTFDVILHGGTLLAVLPYFRRELRLLLAEVGGRLVGRQTQSQDLLGPIVVGSIPGLMAGLLLRDLIEIHLRTPWVVVATLASVGLLLVWADQKGTGLRPWSSLGWKDGLIIGLAQAFALVPGVSRSGITIIAALLLGFSRVDSARFSFLLAIPLIATATAVKVLELQLDSGQALPLVSLVLGVVFSFSSGFLCIKYFLRFLQTNSFLPFAVYRLCLSAFICWWLLA